MRMFPVNRREGLAAALRAAGWLCVSLLISGCVGGASSHSDSGTSESPAMGTAGSSTGSSASSSSTVSVGRTLQGRLLGGSTPIAGAAVELYIAGTAPGSNAATLVARAVSDASGAFELSIDCAASAPGSLIYLSAAGGSTAVADGTNGNTAIHLMASLGPCSALPTDVTVNELTTVAAAYALNAFIGAGGAPSAVGGNQTGLANAMATGAQLADVGSGTFSSSLPTASSCSVSGAPPDCEARAKLSALANALSACVASPAATSPSCEGLFACATPGATVGDAGSCVVPPASEASVSSASPSDTLQAILAIARAPGSIATAGLYVLAQSSSAYGAGPGAIPNDWTLSLNFSGGGLAEPTGVAIDAAGDVWIANYDDAVTELSPTGAALSPAAGFTGGGIEESFGIAVTTDGHIWVCNEQSDGSVNNGLGSVTELAADGSVLSPPGGFTAGGVNFPLALVPDSAGNIWIANYGNSTLSELTESGVALSPNAGYTGGGLSFPAGLALDASGNVWVADEGANQVSELSPSGTALSPATGFGGGGLAVPQSVAVDQTGHVWVTNGYASTVTELSDAGVPVSSGGYSGGGLNGPGGIAIDGAGTIWVANYEGGTITALQGAASATPGVPLSPPSGFTSTSLLQPFALAVDPSGNLWVTNFGNDSVTEFIGLAAPVMTPVIGVPQSPP